MTRGLSSIRRYRATVAYDGTDFAGWQVQPGQRTVQLELERVLFGLTQQTVRVNCSGRTDAGVHARGQVVHFDLATRIPLNRLKLALNGRLPPDVRVLTLTLTRADFDARFSATGKEYRYFIWNDTVLLPDLRRYRHHVRHHLDLKAMKEAARILEGRHDFAAFCANPGYEREGTVRSLFALRVIRRGCEVAIVARGEGFLYKMVRSLAGFLIRVGTGELKPNDAAQILRSHERTAKVPTAPGCGLFLWRVHYGRKSGRRGKAIPKRLPALTHEAL